MSKIRFNYLDIDCNCEVMLVAEVSLETRWKRVEWIWLIFGGSVFVSALVVAMSHMVDADSQQLFLIYRILIYYYSSFRTERTQF